MKPKIKWVQIDGIDENEVIEIQYLDKYTMIHKSNGTFIKTNGHVTVLYEKMEG